MESNNDFACAWLCNFLTFHVYDGVRSKTKVVDCDVLQGSILGPLLFIISMNDICNVSDRMFVIMYADDTCFFNQWY